MGDWLKQAKNRSSKKNYQLAISMFQFHFLWAHGAIVAGDDLDECRRWFSVLVLFVQTKLYRQEDLSSKQKASKKPNLNSLT